MAALPESSFGEISFFTERGAARLTGGWPAGWCLRTTWRLPVLVASGCTKETKFCECGDWLQTRHQYAGKCPGGGIQGATDTANRRHSALPKMHGGSLHLRWR